MRSFRNEQIDLGVKFLIATGYTGQTIEILSDDRDIASARIVGLRLPSYVSASYTYRFGHRR